MEISSIAAATVGLRNAVEIVKFIKDSGASLGAAEIKLKLAELLSTLADAKIEIANAKEKIIEQEAEIISLKRQAEEKARMVWEEPYYFLLKEDNEKDGPFCQKCYDGNGKLIRLQSRGSKGFWACLQCKKSFTDSTYVAPKRPPRQRSSY